jgi:hypothetical protein
MVERLHGFLLREVIGRGGAGVVHRAVAPDGREVALKRLRLGDARAAQRVARELDALARARGIDGVVPLLAHGVDSGEAYLVMPLLPGGTLRERLRQGPLRVGQVLELGERLARALGELHRRGLVHRDVKPENVLFDAAGRPHLADLGLVRHEDTGSMTRSGELRGTLGYMSPEQLHDARRAGPPADVFSLAAVLAECLLGRSPFEGEQPIERSVAMAEGRRVDLAAAGAPALLATLLEQSLDPDPAARPPDGAALAWALRQAAPAARAERRRAIRVGLLAAALALGLALGAAALAHASRAALAPPPAAPGPPGTETPVVPVGPGTAAPVVTVGPPVAPRLGLYVGSVGADGGRLAARPTAVALVAGGLLAGDARGDLHRLGDDGALVGVWRLGLGAVAGVAAARDGVTVVARGAAGSAVFVLSPASKLDAIMGPIAASADVAPGRELLALVDPAGAARVLTRSAMAPLPGGPARAVRFDEAGRRVLVARVDGALELFDALDLRPVARAPGGVPAWEHLDLSTGHDLAVGLDLAGGLHTWRPSSGERRSWPRVAPEPLAVSLEADGLRARCLGARATTLVVLADGRIVEERSLPGPVAAGDVGPDGRVAVAYARTHAVAVLAPGVLPADPVLAGHAAPVRALVGAPGALWSASADGSLRLLDHAVWRLVGRRVDASGLPVPCSGLALREDGAVLAAAWDGVAVGLYDGRTGASIGQAPAGDAVLALALTADGRTLVAAEPGGGVTSISALGIAADRAFWRPQAGAEVAALLGLDADVLAGGPAPDGSGWVGRWSANGAACRWRRVIPAGVTALGRAGDVVLVGQADGRLLRLALADGAVGGTIDLLPGGALVGLSVDRAGTLCAGLAVDGQVALLDLASGAVGRNAAATDPLCSLLLAPDGGLLLGGTSTGRIVSARVER